VANHLSFFDILLLFTLFRPFKWLGKDTFLKIPVMGWVMRLNRYVSVNRKSMSSRGAAYEACREWLRKGVPVVFFPEGTRSPTGEMLPFRSGAFRLAVEEKLPLIPIVLRGTRDILPKKSFVLSGRAQMSLEVLPPVSGEQVANEDVEQLKHRIREEMKERLAVQPA
jgi:1-acyl-sn-glycerol-3-phosphate acyltransferase